MNEYLSDTDIGYPPVPEQLKLQFESGNPWNLADGDVLSDSQVRAVVKERLLGNIFCMSTHLIEKEVVSVADLELGIRTSLAWPKGPFALMNDLGMQETARLVAHSVASGDYQLPKTFAGGTPEPWNI